ncbi:MAG: aminotransferase class III-fold pyridoxal phosphate-dependent enzyme [Spirochaetaceae bacterium]|jgi:acetylornithine/N-succinyldiaminopimelate aminotransferase|nr:aminotransferase class III-fold pyridoxal phosphate-dependent enzyme [Spirochaetaceae bacterium]
MAGNIVNNYGSFPVVFVSGKGATLTDRDGKEYIDFVAGIGVNCLGHGHPALVKAVREQAAKQIHISNYYNSDKGLAFSEALLKRTGMDRVYFGNSGAEANEAAIKLARKYGRQKDETGKRCVIVTLDKSFHGRTLATLAATGQDAFHPPWFAPYPAGFRTIAPNDYAGLDTLDNTVCALMVECVQGEGGVNLLDGAWAQAAAQAARKAGALVIADEVQTGVGRTGAFLACDALGLESDVVTLAKGIAGGIPMGACLFRGPAREVFAAGDHQSTFAGNPLACAAGLVVLEELGRPGFLERVARAGEQLRGGIAGWNLPGVSGVRGKGLMCAFDFAPAPAGVVQKECLDAGLCVTTAGKNVVRMLPPLVISDGEIQRGMGILKTILEKHGA